MQENEGGDFGLRQNLELGKIRSCGLFFQPCILFNFANISCVHFFLFLLLAVVSIRHNMCTYK